MLLAAGSWPYPWPNGGLRVMRVATFAQTLGMAKKFALAAFRTQFVLGQPLNEWYAIATVVKDAGLPREAVDAPFDPDIKELLRANTDHAIDHGVFGVPTVAVGGRLFWGDATGAANSERIDSVRRLLGPEEDIVTELSAPMRAAVDETLPAVRQLVEDLLASSQSERAQKGG